ncbi:gamma-interferon-responsive lysosomal thiol protein-like [Juglans microcarpa x Juglans regia]|uniref:gamma-interferon-responsive lysosomal thiol protein-like n=1 Tax=Juglans microcarpa x Juglans regia TaxID=2249226 RepID=UPI001B7EB03C|nr:gamma-interferon-responsive lysosomal thiol protein-like [Juglans microcarpa x Juglans regia]
MAACRRFLTILVLTNILVSFTTPTYSRSSDKVTVSLYYETLCPYCANFIVSYLVKIFQNDLISVVNLRMIPWGNAWIQSDGTFVCQHGPDECLLNTIEACTITIYPDVVRHFRFIHCVERLSLEGKHNEWTNCFDMTGLGTVPIDCYNSGYGNRIEQKHATETAQLNPPHRFVPWVVVNNQPLQEDYGNFMNYICKAYKGNPRPEACISLTFQMDSTEKANSLHPVCYADKARNFTSSAATGNENIPRPANDSWTHRG